MIKIKYYLYFIINGVLLKPFNLALSYNVGKDPFDDLDRLFDGRSLYCVIDGGAYRGDFSKDVYKRFSPGCIYAFEPQKDSFGMLVNNVEDIQCVSPINYAIGEKSGNAILYKNKSAMTNSLSESSHDALRYFDGYNNPVGQERVELVSLFDFMRENNIDQVDLLKLDLQGHELNALHGLGNRLKDVRSIYIEVNFMRFYEGACLFSEVDNFLRENDFIFYQFYDQVRSPKNGRLLYGDAMFLNGNYFDL